MTPWYEAASPVRRVERDLPGNRLRVVGDALTANNTMASSQPAGWVPDMAPEFSEADRARREGYAEGQRDALERLGDLERQRLHDLASAVGDSARAIRADRNNAVNIAENDVLELAIQLAEAIIGRELELAAAPWRDSIRRALQLASPETEIRLRLHPEDATAALADGQLVNELSELVKIVPDHTVERSGAIADAGSCRIDAQISSAIDRVRDALNLLPEQS